MGLVETESFSIYVWLIRVRGLISRKWGLIGREWGPITKWGTARKWGLISRMGVVIYQSGAAP